MPTTDERAVAQLTTEGRAWRDSRDADRLRAEGIDPVLAALVVELLGTPEERAKLAPVLAARLARVRAVLAEDVR